MCVCVCTLADPEGPVHLLPQVLSIFGHSLIFLNCFCHHFFLSYYFYRPQTKFAKVMFYTCLSVFLFTGGSAPVHARKHHHHHPRDQRQTPPAGADTPHPPEQTPPAALPWCSACWEIRETSGQCASYWNAYLFIIQIQKFSSLALLGISFHN